MSIMLLTNTNDTINLSDQEQYRNISERIEKDVSMTDVLFCFDCTDIFDTINLSDQE